jgi:hypothetical protein
MASGITRLIINLPYNEPKQHCVTRVDLAGAGRALPQSGGFAGGDSKGDGGMTLGGVNIDKMLLIRYL